MRILLLWFFLCLEVLFAQEVYKERKNKTTIGIEAYYSKDTIVLRKANKKLVKLYKKQKDSILLAQYYQYKAKYHEVFYKQDSAYYYYSLSKEISKSLKDSLEVGKCLLYMGNLQREVKDYLGSELNSLEALEYLEPLKSYEYIEKVYANLCMVNLELEESEKVFYYADKVDDYNELTNVRNNTFLFKYVGLFLLRRKQFDGARQFFNVGIKKYLKKSDDERKSEQYAELLRNYAFCNQKLGELENVLKQYLQAIEIFEIKSNIFQLAISYLNIAKYYISTKDYFKAKLYARKALSYSKLSHNNKCWLEVLRILSTLENYKSANKYLQEYIELNDSLVQKERKLTNQFAKIKYENEQKKSENLILKGENEKKKIEITKHKQQILILFLLGIISVLGLIIATFYFGFKRKRLLLERELEGKKSKEQERSRISKELHDGVLGKLFGIRLGLGFLNIESNEKEKYLEYLNELQEIEKEIREVSHKLTIDIEDGYFPELIENLLETKSKIGSFNYSIKIASEINWSIIVNEIKINIHRIIHELLNNIIKHANADFVEIKIDQNNEMLIISLIDNGIGFNEGKILDGIGIKNIKSRITKLKGKLKIKREKGTAIFIEVPF